jgi:hypothetical protein
MTKAPRLLALGYGVSCALALSAAAQATATAPQPTAQRNPQALSLLGQSLAAMTKGRPVQDIKLQAQVTRTAGSDTDTGSAVLEAAAYDKSNSSFLFTSGPRAEIRNSMAGSWSAADAQNRPVALHNSWTTAAWFAPALIVQSWIQDSSFSLAYVGLEDRDGSQVQHVRASRNVSGNADIAALSATDLYLDSQSLLPVALAFNTHPDDDLGVNLPVQITFGSYQTFGGIQAPARIQSFLQNSLLLDVSVTATSANNGLAASEFLVP